MREFNEVFRFYVNNVYSKINIFYDFFGFCCKICIKFAIRNTLTFKYLFLINFLGRRESEKSDIFVVHLECVVLANHFP